MLDDFYAEDLPFTPKDQVVVNQHKHWYVEDPTTRVLCKSIELTLAAGAEETIVLVLKTPLQNKCDMVGSLKISAGKYY